MGNRCTDCNKFVGVEINEEPELEVNIEDEETITGNVRLVKECAECGCELEDAELDITESFEFAHNKSECEGELEITDSSASAGSRSEFGGRYTKTWYTAECEVIIKCDRCEAEQTIQFTVEEQASGFNEC